MRPEETHEVETVGKTENFFTNHVRLISFLSTLLAFLAIFGPISAFHIYDYIMEQRDTRIEMTREELISLADRPAPIRFSELRGYVGEESKHTVLNEEKKPVVKEYYYTIVFEERFTLRAVADAASGELLYLTLYDLESGRKCEVLTEEVAPFFASLPKIKKG